MKNKKNVLNIVLIFFILSLFFRIDFRFKNSVECCSDDYDYFSHAETIALDGDFNTVSGITYYEHKETPGLGAEVDNVDWKKSWIGKKIYQDNQVALTVIKGKVANDDPSKLYKVDGLSGATITGRGVSNMIDYWFGNSGYAKLFEELDYES